MATHKHHSPHYPVKRREAERFWNDDYRALFEPNRARLFGHHKVPKFKARLQQE